MSNRFFCRLARLMRFFWIAAVCDAVYILYTVREFVLRPSAAVAEGFLPSAVPAMTEHVLMSAVMLLLAGMAAEYLRRTY